MTLLYQEGQEGTLEKDFGVIRLMTILEIYFEVMPAWARKGGGGHAPAVAEAKRGVGGNSEEVK